MSELPGVPEDQLCPQELWGLRHRGAGLLADRGCGRDVTSPYPGNSLASWLRALLTTQPCQSPELFYQSPRFLIPAFSFPEFSSTTPTTPALHLEFPRTLPSSLSSPPSPEGPDLFPHIRHVCPKPANPSLLCPATAPD